MPDELAHPPILTVVEVARYLRVSETTVWRWCSSGKLPAFRIGRSWRVRRDDLDRIIGDTTLRADPSVLHHAESSAC